MPINAILSLQFTKKNRFLTDFEKVNTFRPKSACSKAAEIDIIKTSDRSPSNSQTLCLLYVREGMQKRRRCALSFFFFSFTRSWTGREAVSAPPPFQCGLTRA